MKSLIWLIIFFSVWILLNRWLLPRLGIPT